MATNPTTSEKVNQDNIVTGRRTNDRERDTNPDAITGAPGSHPVGTGVGAASVGAAGAVAGAAIGSVVPVIGTVVGGVIGAVVGATGGGLAGKGIAENVNPTAEDAYWRENYESRPYAAGSSYDELAPAYRYGWESRARHSGRKFDEVESDLSRDWGKAKTNSEMGWDKARGAVRDAWDRVDRPSGATTTTGDETVSRLNEIIETLKDGKNGFETAAGNVTDASLKNTFMQFAQQRARFAGELQTIVAQFGAAPEQSGSMSAAMHRGWMGLKNAMGGGDKSILNEAERGEDIAVESYTKALSANLAPAANEAVRRQFGEIKKAHDQVKALRDSRQ